MESARDASRTRNATSLKNVPSPRSARCRRIVPGRRARRRFSSPRARPRPRSRRRRRRRSRNRGSRRRRRIVTFSGDVRSLPAGTSPRYHRDTLKSLVAEAERTRARDARVIWTRAPRRQTSAVLRKSRVSARRDDQNATAASSSSGSVSRSSGSRTGTSRRRARRRRLAAVRTRRIRVVSVVDSAFPPRSDSAVASASAAFARGFRGVFERLRQRRRARDAPLRVRRNRRERRANASREISPVVPRTSTASCRASAAADPRSAEGSTRGVDGDRGP